MKSKLIVGVLGSLIAVSLLLASCASTTYDDHHNDCISDNQH